MICAFLIGSAFQFSGIPQRAGTKWPSLSLIRRTVYQAVVIYLLFKIGFSGGQAITAEPLNEVLFTTLIAALAAVVWTLFILVVLARWSGFNNVTQVSIAAHFGSVSVGTFVAGVAFMEALNIPVSGSVAVWLAMMELPAILVGMWKLGIGFKQVYKIILEDQSLMVLLSAIAIGIWGSDLIPAAWQGWLFKTIFTPILAYFLFEMGRKATASFGQLKGQLSSVIMIGIFMPILGGLIGVSLGSVLGYTVGQMFMLGLLMASASYVLAPISVQQILNALPHPERGDAQTVVATSMALSVGVALPFNVLIGFELYQAYIKAIDWFTPLVLLGFALPVLVLMVSRFTSPKKT